MRARSLVAAGVAGVLALGAVVGLAPDTAAPDPATATGDRALAARAAAALAREPGLRDRVSVIEVTPDGVRQAHFGGGDEDTVYEIGSVTKTVTAALYEDAVQRGEVRRDTRLGDVFALGDAPAADVTLDELAGHTSGLPRLAPGLGRTAAQLAGTLLLLDPYRDDLPGLLAAAGEARLEGRGEVAYSNFGFALLGQAVARQAGATWPALVRDRITGPLGMASTSAPTSPADLPADAPSGRTASGRTADPWTMSATAPAGSIRSTPADVTRWVRALLDGSAPGAAALDPRTRDGDRSIGSAWFTQQEEGSDGPVAVTWHNGGTGGFRSMVALDRDAGRAVIVLSDTAVPVDAAAFALLLGVPA